MPKFPVLPDIIGITGIPRGTPVIPVISLSGYAGNTGNIGFKSGQLLRTVTNEGIASGATQMGGEHTER